MAYSVLHSKGTFVASGTTLTVTLGFTPTTGNKLVVCVATADTPAPVISSVQDTNNNNLTQAKSVSLTIGGGALICAIYFYDVPATAPSTIKVNQTTGSASTSAVVQEVSGLLAGNTTACLDGTFGSTTGSSTPTGSATYSSTASSEFLVTMFGDFGNSVTCTQPTGYTLDGQSVNANPDANCCVGYKNSTNGSEGSSWSYTPTSGDMWGVVTGAFKLAATASGYLWRRPPITQAVHRAAFF